MKSFGVLVISLGIPLTATGQAQNPPVALRGIHQMRVVVESLETSASKVGLSAAELRTQLELPLRQIGIDVVPVRQGSAPLLYLRVRISEPLLESVYVTTLELSLWDGVRLMRDSTISTWAVTWRNNRGAAVDGADNVKTRIREELRELMDDFANGYLTENPRR